MIRMLIPLFCGSITLAAADVSAQALALMEAKCWRCHGSDKGRGGLRMHTPEALAKGGENGAVVVPGKPAESRIISAVKRSDPETAMPPKDGEALTPAEVAVLTAWVQAGAKWPGAK